MERRRVGIMGGTFNPIHYGHLTIAKHAYEKLSLDEIIFIPSGTSYMKTNVLDSEKRYSMTSIAIEGIPYFSISDIETSNSGNSYSYKTILKLKEKNPTTDFFFIIGADSLVSMKKWKNPDIIFSETEIIVACRNSNTLSEINETISEYRKDFKANITVLSMPTIDISSSEIREKVKNNLSIKDLVPPDVEKYIDDNNLYRS